MVAVLRGASDLERAANAAGLVVKAAAVATLKLSTERRTDTMQRTLRAPHARHLPGLNQRPRIHADTSAQ